MPLSSSSLAAAVGAGALNVKFQATALNIPRKILIIGTYDAAKTGIADEVPELSSRFYDSCRCRTFCHGVSNSSLHLLIP